MNQKKSYSEYLKEIEERKLQIENNMENVRHKIIILSGKGGVGKSTITANIAITLAKKGYSIGIFDYDFHGPAIPKMLGVDKENLKAFPLGIFPVKGILDIKIVSIAFLLPNEKTPVIWRGPMKYNALQELMANVIWGKIDYLLFDLPPGTGDEALNIARIIPNIDGAILVTIPSEISRISVEKAAEFCKTLKINLIGVIENMSYFICPKCGYKIEIFGSGGGEKIVEEEKIPFLGKIPLNPKISKCMDNGKPIVLSENEKEIFQIFNEIADKIINQINK